MNLNSRQKKNILYALGINYVIYILLRLFFFTTYESQIDIMMQAAVRGVSGTKTAGIIYSNIILGWIIKVFTVLIPFMNGYYVYLVFGVLTGLSVISYILLLRTDRKLGMTLSVVLASFIGYECYILPGYMKTASVIGIAMLVVLADTFERGILKSRKRIAVTIGLGILCSMICLSVFLITMFLGAAGIIIYDASQHEWKFFSWFRKDGKIAKEQLKSMAVVVAAIIIGGTFLYGIDIISYISAVRMMP